MLLPVFLNKMCLNSFQLNELFKYLNYICANIYYIPLAKAVKDIMKCFVELKR